MKKPFLAIGFMALMFSLSPNDVQMNDMYSQVRAPASTAIHIDVLKFENLEDTKKYFSRVSADISEIKKYQDSINQSDESEEVKQIGLKDIKQKLQLIKENIERAMLKDTPIREEDRKEIVLAKNDIIKQIEALDIDKDLKEVDSKVADQQKEDKKLKPGVKEQQDSNVVTNCQKDLNQSLNDLALKIDEILESKTGLMSLLSYMMPRTNAHLFTGQKIFQSNQNLFRGQSMMGTLMYQTMMFQNFLGLNNQSLNTNRSPSQEQYPQGFDFRQNGNNIQVEQTPPNGQQTTNIIPRNPRFKAEVEVFSVK